MTCLTARRRLAALAGDELDPRRAAALRAHLKTCQACRAERDRLTEGLAALRRAGRRADLDLAPEIVWHGVRRHLCATGSLQPAPERARRLSSTGAQERTPVEDNRWHPGIAIFRPVRVAAVVVVLVAGAMIGLWLNPWRGGADGPVSVARGRIEGPLASGGRRRAYRLVVPPPFTLENAPRYETGLTTYHLPGLSPLDGRPGQGFVLEEVRYNPQDGRRMTF